MCLLSVSTILAAGSALVYRPKAARAVDIAAVMQRQILRNPSEWIGNEETTEAAKLKHIKMNTQENASFDAIKLEGAQEGLGELLKNVPVRPALTRSARSKLAVVGDRTRPFLVDALDAIAANPDIVPRGMDVAALLEKADAHDNLRRLEASADQFVERVRDVRMQLGNELYQVVLAIYALMGKPIAGAALKPRREALKQRFKKYGRRKDKAVQPNSDAQAVKG